MPVFSFLTQPTDSQIAEILSLYQTAGWWQSDGSKDDADAQVRDIIRGSHCFLIVTDKTASAQEAAPVIGMGRSISDGASDAYIQDVVVAPPHRGQGIASRIVAHIVQRLRDDGIQWIGLIAERHTQELYRPLGFKPMTDSTPMLNIQ